MIVVLKNIYHNLKNIFLSEKKIPWFNVKGLSAFKESDDEFFSEFFSWAFGTNQTDLTGIEYLKRWNDRHGNILLLKEEGEIQQDIKKMAEIWINQRRKK